MNLIYYEVQEDLQVQHSEFLPISSNPTCKWSYFSSQYSLQEALFKRCFFDIYLSSSETKPQAVKSYACHWLFLQINSQCIFSTSLSWQFAGHVKDFKSQLMFALFKGR